jgi:hypothetical protein
MCVQKVSSHAVPTSGVKPLPISCLVLEIACLTLLFSSHHGLPPDSPGICQLINWKNNGHKNLLGLRREWGNGMVISSDYGSFPRSMSINWTCRWTHDEPMSPPCHQIPQSLLSFSHNWLLGQTRLAMPWIKIHTDTALCAWHCALGGGVFPSRLSLH